ncbi:WD domain G-beta repeat protein [Paragonimus heterotremus]|uniref:WD domain G-beta repeat protein n=1 Tax=Paragonimus heterotremus TaxID=100268 RepID=A0A8J4TEP4_9TREM|nr:WD domain G-beta repeat protein [Paragonimus heterotremus]
MSAVPLDVDAPIVSNRGADKTSNKAAFSDNVYCQTIVDFADATVLVVRVTPDGKYWIAGLRNGRIKLMPTIGDPNSNIQELQVDEDCTSCVDIQCVPPLSSFSSEKNHRLIAVYASGAVRVWYYTGATPESRLLATHREYTVQNQEDGRRFSRRAMFNQLLACSCSPDARRFVTGGDDCHIRVYDLEQQEPVRTLGLSCASDRVDGHVMRICALKYHPRGSEDEEYSHVFVSGGWDDTVHVWDDRFEHSLWMFAGPHISGSDALDIEPFSNTILTSSWRHDKTLLQVWKFSDRILSQIRGNTGTLDGESNNTDSSTMRIEEVIREKPIAEIPQESFEVRSKGYVAKWIGDGYIAFGGSDANVLRIMTRGKPRTVATVSDIPNGVFSLAYIPLSDDVKKPIQMAFAAGPKVYIIRLDQK